MTYTLHKDQLTDATYFVHKPDDIQYVHSPKKERQHVKKYNLLQISNIILNTEISITLH